MESTQRLGKKISHTKCLTRFNSTQEKICSYYIKPQQNVAEVFDWLIAFKMKSKNLFLNFLRIENLTLHLINQITI